MDFLVLSIEGMSIGENGNGLMGLRMVDELIRKMRANEMVGNRLRLGEVSAGLGDFAAGEALLNDVFIKIDVDGFTLAEGGRLIMEDIM